MNLPSPTTAELLRSLERLPGATALRMQAGQVLVDERHVPAGIFVLLSGIVEERAEGDSPRLVHRWEAAGGPRVVPDLEVLSERSPRTLTIAKEAEFVFLPRTLVLENGNVQQALRELGRRAPG